jgi:hypothetical protein
MGNIDAYNAISSGDAVLATVVSGNFSKIEAAINSNALNSENYGQSSILSDHISTNQILSQHLADGAVVSAKISDNAVVSAKISDSAVVKGKIGANAITQGHMLFNTTDDGVRAVQIGAAASDLPAGGVHNARLTKEVEQSASIMSVTFNFSDAIDGNPAFTAIPIVCGNPVAVVSASTVIPPEKYQLINTASESMEIMMRWAASADATMTFHVAVQGPVAEG